MPHLPTCCDPDRLRRLAEDRLPPPDVSRLEQHLEQCAACREALDLLVGDDRCLAAVRRYLGSGLNDSGEPSPVVVDSLGVLAPSDWPDSIGRLGNYEIKGVLGRGGMGVVLKAFDPALHRNVAIKVLSAPLAASAGARRRFLREARAAAAVVHEHVVAVYAVVESAGLPFLVMEYVPGRSLQDRLDGCGPLSPLEVLRIGMQTASGLAAAHAQGLVHRDVKPANILLEAGVERVRLSDFGLARAADDAATTQSGVVAGTPHYMAPEQARGQTIDARADLFSLGSTLYAACVGHPPFRAESPLAVLRRVCDDAPRPIRDLNPEIPAWLETIIVRLMAKDPAQRPQTANEVAGVFARCLAHVQQPLESPLPTALDRPTTSDRPARGLRRLAPTAALVTVVALAGVWLARPSRRLPAPGRNAGATIPPTTSTEFSRTPGGSSTATSPEDFQRLIDDAKDRVRAVQDALHARPGRIREDRLTPRTAALAQQAKVLERELLSSHASSAALIDAIPALKPHQRSRP